MNSLMKMYTLRIRRLLVLSVFLFAVAAGYGADKPVSTLMEEGHFKQARALLEKRLAANANDGEAMFLLARVKLEFQDADGATKLAEKAVELLPKDARAHAVLADCYGTRAQGDVGMFEGMKWAKAFRREAEAALAIDPNNLDALHSMVEFHLDAPGIVGGSKSKAREMAQKIGAINPTRGGITEAEILWHEKKFDQALAAFQKAADGDPKSYEAQVRVGTTSMQEKWRDTAKAEMYARRAIALDPQRGAAYGLLMQAKVWAGSLNDLDPLLAQAEKAVPDDFIYYFRAGRSLLITSKDPERAEKYLRKFLTQEPEGNTQTLAIGHWQLGLALEKLGRKQDAANEVQAALNLQPDLKPAKSDLKRLKS
jgi:tetratricopeptide (TPR) repeat protein